MKLFEDIDFLTGDSINQSNIRLLSGMIEKGNVSHAYLFSGNNMKLLTRLALIFAASINCPGRGCGDCIICRNTLGGVYANILIVEPEGRILRIEEIARLQRFMSLTSYNLGKKICVIKESELMNAPAANRLLKTLEDPPDEDSIFILLTEDISMLLPTVVSRCLVYSWNFKFIEETPERADFEIMEKYLDEGIKKIIMQKEGSDKSYTASLDLTLKLIEILKKVEAAVKADQEKEIGEIKRSDFDRSDITRYIEILKLRNKRKISKFRNLGMSRVFDIISAWLEDIMTVKLGAGNKIMNFSKNYSFISSKGVNVKIDRIFELIKIIEGNKNYLGYSINPELALDNIFLQFQNIYR
jgi:DNA polymerase III delta prime subunit